MADSTVFRTKAAATYLSANGVQMSPSKLEKLRLRGEEDPRDRGPDFYRDEAGVCWYERGELDLYIDKRMEARRFRARGQQPANFKNHGGHT